MPENLEITKAKYQKSRLYKMDEFQIKFLKH